jgi:hypothetical protein
MGRMAPRFPSLGHENIRKMKLGCLTKIKENPLKKKRYYSLKTKREQHKINNKSLKEQHRYWLINPSWLQPSPPC